MDNQDFGKYKFAFIILAAALVILQIPRVLDLKHTPHEGFSTDGNNTVTKIESGSPAEQAGFLVGDYITSNGGINTDDTKALVRRPRPDIGEIRTYMVNRSGESVNLNLIFSGLPPKRFFLWCAGVIIGFSFLFSGLTTYLKIQTKSTTLLTVVGLCLGFAFIGGIYIDSYEFRMIYWSIFPWIVFCGLASLLHFMMVFPTPKPMLERKNTVKLLYTPAVILALVIFYLNIVQPDRTSGLNTAMNVLFGLFIAGYFGLSVFAMAHSYFKASSNEKQLYGLNFMLLGTVIGLAPVVIAQIVRVIAPKVELPGNEFYVLTMVLIPISLSLATVKKEIPREPVGA